MCQVSVSCGGETQTSSTCRFCPRPVLKIGPRLPNLQPPSHRARISIFQESVSGHGARAPPSGQRGTLQPTGPSSQLPGARPGPEDPWRCDAALFPASLSPEPTCAEKPSAAAENSQETVEKGSHETQLGLTQSPGRRPPHSLSPRRLAYLWLLPSKAK